MDHPCPFCNSSCLKPGEICTWEHTNAVTGIHYLLKDRLMEWDGRPARMEIAFDMTELEQRKQELQYALDAEKMVMDCVRTLYQEGDISKAIPQMLRQLGSFLSAGRAYLFAVHGAQLDMEYEWCAEQVTPQLEQLKNMPLSILDRWIPIFQRQECVIIESVEELKGRWPEEYEVLRRQDIRTLVAAPLEQNGRLAGCLGVDNPPPDRLKNIAPLLQTLCYFVMLAWRRAQSERELSRLSYQDTLTGFFNRNRYIQDTEILSASHQPFGIVYLDVNGLKDVNDRLGHQAGDRLLVRCADMMRKAFPSGADFYRIGGDEFVVICLGMEKENFENQVHGLRLCVMDEDFCRAAAGACWSEDSGRIREIITKADARMYEDKKAYYHSHPTSHRYRHGSDELLHLANPEILREKIEKNQFVVYFQPKVSSSDQSTVGAEALVRYCPRPDTLVLPGNFLPLLEERQLIRQLDFFVFEFVCSKVKEWIDQGKQTVPISVNFSRCSLSQPGFLKELMAVCGRYGIERRLLAIEITENIREEDSINLRELVPALREAGFSVSIDDFGTEYANLALLSSVQFDELKLDKSVVDNVAHSPQAQTVVESIVEICRKMKIRLVAEGIETEEQLTVLRRCGVKLVQGFLVGKPCALEEYEKKYL